MSPDRVIHAPAPLALRVFVYVCLVAAVAALPLAIYAALAREALEDDRREDQAEVSIELCRQGNVSRQETIAGLTAVHETFVAILAESVALVGPTAERLTEAAQPALGRLRDAIRGIALVDCPQAVPDALSGSS